MQGVVEHYSLFQTKVRKNSLQRCCINRCIPLLGMILLIALALRLWGITSGLPYIYNSDEPVFINITQTIFKTRDLNPHFFNYPSLFFYINVLAYIPYYGVGKLAGIFQNRADLLSPISLAMGVTFAPSPATVILGRLVTVAFGVATVGLTYFFGTQLSGKTSLGLLASLGVAISPANVYFSRLITPDTFVTFFSLAAALASLLVYQQGKTWQYILAGLCVGFAASTKYNCALIGLTLLMAHFLRDGAKGFTQPRLYLGLFFCAVGFLATSPYILIDWAGFLSGVGFEARHYATGHLGMEGNTLAWYLNFMGQTAGIIYALALLAVIQAIFSRQKNLILASAFPVVYFIFICFFVVRNERTFLPITPFLFTLAASFIVFLFPIILAISSKQYGKVVVPVITCLALATFTMPVGKTIINTIHQTTVDSRETARIWINDNLPDGAKIAIESYSPFIDTSRFSVHGFTEMIDQSPDWYKQQEFDYLVFSQGMYGRFFQNPVRYAGEVSKYKTLFGRFPLVKLFDDAGFEVRVYQVK